jgi:outer membrane protein
VRHSLNQRHHYIWIPVLALLTCGSGCRVGIFDNESSYWRPTPSRVDQIDAVDLADQSLVKPTSLDVEAEELLAEKLPLPEYASTTPLTLSEVRRSVLEHNLDLQVEVISPEIARAELGAEEAKFEATIFAGYTRDSNSLLTNLEQGNPTSQDAFSTGVRFPIATGGTITVDTLATKADAGVPGTQSDPWQSNLNFSISQPLLRNAGVNSNTASIRIAKWNRDIADARLKLSATRVLADADKAYWNLYATWRELEVRKQNYELAVAQYERAQRRLDAGDAPEIDVVRAQSGIGRTLETIITADAALRRAQRKIKRIMNQPGFPVSSSAMFLPATDPNPLKLELDGKDLANQAVENRMEMLELELQLAVDSADIDLKRNLTLPAFAVDYTYTIKGSSGSFGGAYGNLGDNDSYRVGLNGEIPIGNKVAKNTLETAILRRVQRLATRSARTQAIETEVYDALDALRSSWQSILAARLETVFATRTYEGEQRQFNVGMRTSTDVLDAASRLADAQSREVRSLAEYQVALIDIAFATGTLLGHSRIRFDTESELFIEEPTQPSDVVEPAEDISEKST